MNLPNWQNNHKAQKERSAICIRISQHLLQYAETILKDRSIRWDEEITGLINKATDCIVHCIIASIKDVMTKDIKKRIKVVMLSGRAFYFDDLRTKLKKN